jgi:polysaccharide biosynthesis protein PslG
VITLPTFGWQALLFALNQISERWSMKKLCRWLSVLLLVIFLCLAVPKELLRAKSASHPQPIPHRFFGMTTHWYEPWPVIQFGGLRLWSTQTKWSDLNPSAGVYDWTTLDNWLALAKQNGAPDTVLTLAMTPQWASSNPNDPTCHFGPGQCDPPSDLNPDGTGTDQHWKDYITAVATHVNGQIRAWEIWNEPVNYYYWNGTFAQMVRLAKDARTIILGIDPNAVLLTPPNGSSRPYGENWWKAYAALGGLNYADIIATHAGGKTTCQNQPVASDLIDAIANLRTIMNTYGAQGKPIWDTEANWGNVDQNCYKDQDMQAAFLGQFYMFHVSLKIKRFYWFAYDDGNTGELWNSQTGLNKGGIAYENIRDWMLGATMIQNCSSSGNSIWTCGFKGSHSYVAEAIWDTNEKCSKGTCQTVNQTVPSTYTQYRTLDGKTIAIANNKVPIGAKPILLENHSR